MRTWFIELLALTLLGFCGIYLYQLTFPLSALSHSAYCALIMFSIFTFFIFSMMNLFQHQLSGQTVAGITMAAVLGRVIIVVLSLMWYKSTFQPQGKWFVVPFLIFYLVFLVYENYKLIQIGNEVDRG